MCIKTYLFSSFQEIHKIYKCAGSQKKNTCGPFTLAYILNGLGFISHNKHKIDEDYLAYLSGVQISREDYIRLEKIKKNIQEGNLSPKEAEKNFPDVYYRYELPYSEKDSEIGTSCKGIIRACEISTDNKMTAIPVPSIRNGVLYFTEKRFSQLTRFIIEFRKNYSFQIILNYRTDKLLYMNSKNYNLFNLFFSKDPVKLIENDPWAEGHFVSTCGIIEYQGKEFYIIRDTYKNKGYEGYHIQPADILRKALIRNDDREGGMLFIIPENYKKDIEKVITEMGFVIDTWDNGSVFHKLKKLIKIN